jgi:hypothetical protein
LERAKDELMRAVEAAESPQPEERALRLLDYRNYHRYDVVMEPVTGGAAISAGCAAHGAKVIENASTWDSYSRWNSAHGSFSAVVYGAGNRFLDSVARLNDIFTEIGGPRRVLYFGDLDPQGLRIPQIASRRAQLQGLPAIEADSWSYARLLELGSAP